MFRKSRLAKAARLKSAQLKGLPLFFDKKDSGKAIADELCICMMRLLTIQSPRQFSIRMQFGKQMLDNFILQRNFLCQSSKTASACMSHRQLRKSQPIAVNRLTFSRTRLSVLKIHITIMLTSQRNSMTSRLLLNIYEK